MFAKRLPLFSIYGIDLAIDPSWFLVAILIVWSLASGLFPAWYGGLPTSVYWAIGVVGALGLFVAIVFHEVAHALVARHYGVTIHGITLFLFGGVAEMQDETARPGAEFSIAVEGRRLRNVVCTPGIIGTRLSIILRRGYRGGRGCVEANRSNTRPSANTRGTRRYCLRGGASGSGLFPGCSSWFGVRAGRASAATARLEGPPRGSGPGLPGYPSAPGR